MSAHSPHARGTDLARLLLRTAIGGTMITHGLRHARTLDGTANWFGSIGFREPRLQAGLSALVEIGGGAALMAGAATPLAASSVVGTMCVAARSVHAPNGFFVNAEGYEYVANLAIASVALAAIGPGKWSVDAAFGLDHARGSRKAAVMASGLGLAGAVLQLAAYWRRPAPAPVFVEASVDASETEGA